MAEASVHIPDLSATSTVSFTEEYAGAFGFQLDLEGLSELPDVWFSEELNKVFCCRCVAFPVLMNVSFPLPSGSIIRAMAVFRDPEYAAEVVTCCPHHEQLLRDSGDVAHAEHLIQVEGNEQAEYFSDSETERHSITVPFEEFSKSTTVWYKFMCYTSCFVNMNRRSILTIITLESPRGQVVG
ncbi:cellular tumor antigen p53-like [Liasis olivaceus]